jgi:hypothetical protein
MAIQFPPSRHAVRPQTFDRSNRPDVTMSGFNSGHVTPEGIDLAGRLPM